MWSYPDLWPGLHASHESPPPDRPGELIGTTRLLGDFVTPKARRRRARSWPSTATWATSICSPPTACSSPRCSRTSRLGRPWAMPIARREMLLNDLTLHDENFWPSITQTADGKVYLVDGGRTSLVRVDGLDSIRRLPDATLQISGDELQQAAAYQPQSELARQQSQGPDKLTVTIRAKAPVVDGKLDDWAGASWVDIDKSGVAAFFDSNSQAAQRHRRAGRGRAIVCMPPTKSTIRTCSTIPASCSRNLFKTGGALDLMIGCRRPGCRPPPRPRGGRRRAVAGHARQRQDGGHAVSTGRRRRDKRAGAVQFAAAHDPLRPRRRRQRPGATRLDRPKENEKAAHGSGDLRILDPAGHAGPQAATRRKRFAATSASSAGPNSKRSSASTGGTKPPASRPTFPAKPN